ncbi:type IV toxin-antitoxin system AbiEi family antitoxin domain-containing protein [Leucobacter insecticola]|uniref:Type IV toxin-antitoxin system AbiEi family antitoxin domain-containing protein n=2 Tax=Leucobacter insecticola TaxID=2714934 RepID=A0A6G8FL94_9MICO|nr:type IV toxin-antitoxin system AbiEi family antitoxin domain-containing protein [Leucobacter insecticola]
MLILTRSELLLSGLKERGIARQVRDGVLLRLTKGLYVVAESLQSLTPEERHLVMVFAVATTMRTESLFSSYSAAALWGLPLYEFRAAPPQTLVSHTVNVSNTRTVVRRVAHYSDAEVAKIGGVYCTSLPRTILDLARLDTPERAIACADAAMSLLFPVDRGAGMSDAAQVWRQELLDQLGRERGGRGVRRAANVIRLADGSADSPLESVARLRFVSHGYAVASQVEVPAPGGHRYHIDLELLGLGIFCEVDGKQKYTEPEFRGGLTAEEVVFREKKRAEWIENKTRKRVHRLGYAELRTPATFTRWLRDARIPAPRAVAAETV